MIIKVLTDRHEIHVEYVLNEIEVRIYETNLSNRNLEHLATLDERAIRCIVNAIKKARDGKA